MSINQNFPNVFPSVSLDFENSKTLDPRITFTRSSVGTYVGADGLIKTAAADEPRFNHDPETGKSLGLLIEELRTNIHTYSIPDSNWTQSNCTLTLNNAIAPDNTQTASLFTGTGGSSVGHYIYLNHPTQETFYTQTFFVKAGTTEFVQIATSTGWQARYANFQLTGDGVVGNEDIVGPVTIEKYPNGWYRIRVTEKAIVSYAGNSARMILSSVDSLTASRISNSSEKTFYVWGAQIEAGLFPTSYIPTSGSTLTRSQDSCILPSSFLNAAYSKDKTLLSTTENSAIVSILDGSTYFAGDADYLDISASSDFAFGTGNFTVEGWVNTTFFNADGPNNRRIYMTDGPTGNNTGNLQIILDINNQGGLYVWSTSGDLNLITTGSLANGKWNHFAVCRSGTTLTAFVNGFNVGSTIYAGNITANGGSPRPRIGNFGGENGAGDFNGYISNLRVVKGTALYKEKENFSPEFPLDNITNTKLICCNSARDILNNSGGKTITAQGSVSSSSYIPAQKIKLDSEASSTNTIKNLFYYGSEVNSNIIKSSKSYTSIIRDGLILNFDAKNSRSYPGAGSIWNDLSSSKFTGTLQGGIVYDNSGGLILDGTDDYITTDLGAYTPYCIDIWFYNDDPITSAIMQGNFQQLLGVGTGSGGITLGNWTSSAVEETFSFFSSTWNSGGMTYIRDTAQPGIHNLIVNWNGSNYDFWLDGTKRTTYESAYGHCVLQSRTGLDIGRDPGGANSYEFDGKIYSVKIYNIMLSDENVMQNFNALRSRFRI